MIVNSFAVKLRSLHKAAQRLHVTQSISSFNCGCSIYLAGFSPLLAVRPCLPEANNCHLADLLEISFEKSEKNDFETGNAEVLKISKAKLTSLMGNDRINSTENGTPSSNSREI